MKRHFANMVFALILAAYTVYAALDTFVIVRVLTPDTLPTATAEASTAPTEAPTTVPTATESPAEQATTAPISADTEYHDDQIDIVLTTMRVENTTVYVADVQIADISLLKTALAGNTYARNLTETTSVQAANAGAILAINGDYYGAQERGYVLRNGVLYRASAQSGTDALVIGADGNFRIITEGETSADTLVREGAWQVLTFGPALINGGQVTVSSSDEVGRAMTSNPRTAIGQISEGHYLLVVSDGRTKESAGLSLRQLAELMQSLGAQVAYNLDGGGSSTMVFQGRVVSIITEGETSADTLVREGAWQVLTFGPALINGGQVTVSSSDEVGRAMTSNPRTAIGQISEGHYLLVVSDGRTKESAGLSLRQLAELMQSLGAQVAYNLDGGGSSTMVFQGRVVNNPTTNGRSIRERSVSDIVYIGY